MKPKVLFNSIAFKQAFENLKDIDNLDDVLAFYDEECYFKDPFHNIRSKKIIRKLFVNMFKGLNNPRFTDLKMLSDEAIIVISWTFVFERKGKKVKIALKVRVGFKLMRKVIFHTTMTIGTALNYFKHSNC